MLSDGYRCYNEPDYYRRNYKEALAKSIVDGDEWLERNKSFIASTPIPCSVTRWEDWRLHPDFEGVRSQIAHVYADDRGMQESVEVSVQRYLQNNPGGDNDLKVLRAEASRCYILEELAGLTLFAREYGTWEVYAGSKIAALDYLKSAHRGDLPEPLLKIRSLKINLKEVRPARSS